MAIIHPPLPDIKLTTSGAYRERDILQQLAPVNKTKTLDPAGLRRERRGIRTACDPPTQQSSHAGDDDFEANSSSNVIPAQAGIQRRSLHNRLPYQ